MSYPNWAPNFRKCVCARAHISRHKGFYSLHKGCKKLVQVEDVIRCFGYITPLAHKGTKVTKSMNYWLTANWNSEDNTRSDVNVQVNTRQSLWWKDKMSSQCAGWITSSAQGHLDYIVRKLYIYGNADHLLIIFTPQCSRQAVKRTKPLLSRDLGRPPSHSPQTSFSAGSQLLAWRMPTRRCPAQRKRRGKQNQIGSRQLEWSRWLAP